jgi:hypothetical protein
MPNRQKVPRQFRRDAACVANAIIKKITLAMNQAAPHCAELVRALLVHTGNRGNSMADLSFPIRRTAVWSRNQSWGTQGACYGRYNNRRRSH